MNENNPFYCSFVSVDYIICECGDNFATEDALKEHLERDKFEHQLKISQKTWSDDNVTVINEYKCGTCEEIFDTAEECMQHQDLTHVNFVTKQEVEDEYNDNEDFCIIQNLKQEDDSNTYITDDHLPIHVEVKDDKSYITNNPLICVKVDDNDTYVTTDPPIRIKLDNDESYFTNNSPNHLKLTDNESYITNNSPNHVKVNNNNRYNSPIRVRVGDNVSYIKNDAPIRVQSIPLKVKPTNIVKLSELEKVKPVNLVRVRKPDYVKQEEDETEEGDDQDEEETTHENTEEFDEDLYRFIPRDEYLSRQWRGPSASGPQWRQRHVMPKASVLKERRKKKKKKPTQNNYHDAICEVCGKKYASNVALRYHQRVHTGVRPYACSYCPKTFTMPLFQQIHTRIHTGVKPYRCAVCPKAFTNKAALLRHDRVHTGEKPYECPKCGKSFSQSNSMKLHVRTVHLKLPAPYKSKRRKAAMGTQDDSRDAMGIVQDDSMQEAEAEIAVRDITEDQVSYDTR